ncbi:putative general negative regulator of transcription C16C9.04c [Mycena sanguinolenta]|uniref:Putative general negative regulator of transcription C16C9.04c n=1 Tax=Mycena sanguinolenta TaxID=230812 RepID=A0A8H7D581_9AGAR|nr:putative general negative regulator of transcription C16C9.04c [Mycena sanguinolenta]
MEGCATPFVYSTPCLHTQRLSEACRILYILHNPCPNMSRLHPLPAPVVHAGFSVSQSKSTVLAGVQDAYWSDDEAEDAECPLCLEEMDISDLNFKPCMCGYQASLASSPRHYLTCFVRYAASAGTISRRISTSAAPPVGEYTLTRVWSSSPLQLKSAHKRLTQQKKQRERERKELDALGRRHLANVRVVQRNVVYVVGIGPRFAKEELIPTLRSNEYFGQYGKITKILLVKRTPSGGGAPVVGLYITYHRREDAARAISAVDGTTSPGGGREIMRASHGTTKYCMAFLRSVTCNDHACMNLHEWGDEKDCFTKEDLTTLKHTMKATESRTRNAVGKKDDSEGLPKAAAWGKTPAVSATTSTVTNQPSSVATVRPTRRGAGGVRQGRSTATTASPSTAETRTPTRDRKSGNAKNTTQPPTSRPSTPSSLPQRPATPESRVLRTKKEAPTGPQPSPSPAPSVAAESDVGSHDATPASPTRPRSTDSVISSTPSVPPGLPAVPPGLSGPPGIAGPSRPPRVGTASPQTPLLASQSSYQMSTAARALLDDVKQRRELGPTPVVQPFPDFDRTLDVLNGQGGGGFSFNLDPKLAVDDADAEVNLLPDFEAEAKMPFHGTYMDAFPALRSSASPGSSPFMTPPGLPYPHNPNRSIYDPLSNRSSMAPIERQSTGGSSGYMGSFNPFADAGEDSPKPYSPLDDDRKVSRFGFARGRQGSTTTTSSPLHVPSPLAASSSEGHSFYNSSETVSPQPPAPPMTAPWGSFYSLNGSATSSPLAPHSQVQPQPVYNQQQSRFQPFETGVSEAQLRDFIQSSRERASSATGTTAESTAPFGLSSSQSFADPAIMAAQFAPPPAGYNHNHGPMGYGPPPGLSYGAPPGIMQHPSHGSADGLDGSAHVSTTESPALSLALSATDFPALATAADSAGTTVQSPTDEPAPTQDDKALEKAERKAAKKAAAAEKAAERQKIAQEKALLKTAERARIAQEKALEKERALKAQQEQAQKEKLEKENTAKERERERLAKLEQQKQVEKEKEAQAERERAKKAAVAKSTEPKLAKRADSNTASASKTATKQASASKPATTQGLPEPVSQVPLLSKKPKKNKPTTTKPIKVSSKEEEHVPADETSTVPPTSAEQPSIPPAKPATTATSSSDHSRSESLDGNVPTTVEELLEDLHILNPMMDLPDHIFFDVHKLNPASKMPLEYGPLVHALSALSVGGGSFANGAGSGPADTAISSFQELLETLTQTISALLRLLPRTTWDESSYFDGVLGEMLKGGDYDNNLDDSKDNNVEALTLALERRARWMEVQLSKLEELHRDINTAAVRAVLSFNDNGWDRHGFLPRVGNTLRRFDSIGLVEEDGVTRSMTADELEKKLIVAKEAAVFAETEVRELMEKMHSMKPLEDE